MPEMLCSHMLATPAGWWYHRGTDVREPAVEILMTVRDFMICRLPRRSYREMVLPSW